MSEATTNQINAICEIADGAMQEVLQSHFGVSNAEAAQLVTEQNYNKLKEAIQMAAINSISDILGRRP